MKYGIMLVIALMLVATVGWAKDSDSDSDSGSRGNRVSNVCKQTCDIDRQICRLEARKVRLACDLDPENDRQFCKQAEDDIKDRCDEIRGLCRSDCETTTTSTSLPN